MARAGLQGDIRKILEALNAGDALWVGTTLSCAPAAVHIGSPQGNGRHWRRLSGQGGVLPLGPEPPRAKRRMLIFSATSADVGFPSDWWPRGDPRGH